VSERRRFFPSVSDADLLVCGHCGGEFRRDQMAKDASTRTGRKGLCVPCDLAKSRRYYAENRERILARAAAKRPAPEPKFCSECGEKLEPPRRVVCSPRCRERRFRRLHPEAYAAREARKVERRRAKRRGEL
jgi:hypothetical protein